MSNIKEKLEMVEYLLILIFTNSDICLLLNTGKLSKFKEIGISL